MASKSMLTEVTEMLFKQAQRLYAADSESVQEEVERSKALDSTVGGIRENVKLALNIETARREWGIAPSTVDKLLESSNG